MDTRNTGLLENHSVNHSVISIKKENHSQMRPVHLLQLRQGKHLFNTHTNMIFIYMLQKLFVYYQEKCLLSYIKTKDIWLNVYTIDKSKSVDLVSLKYNYGNQYFYKSD